MKPNKKFITIKNNKKLIKKLIFELVLVPRLEALKWSKITQQTPNMKIGYPGQHLASLIVGMVGRKTGGRGNDIIDGSEVKSCSRIDALDTCRDCKEKISRDEEICPYCGSNDIKRDNTSKWLFTIRSEDDLKLLTEKVKRVILILADYPNFENNDFEDIRIQAFEIWTNSPRCKAFKEAMEDYYKNIYLYHKVENNAKTPAPQNFWPYKFMFYKCNPIKIFSCYVKAANKKPEIIIEHYINPDEDRNNLESELMPTILAKDELPALMKSAPKEVVEENINESYNYDELIQLFNTNRYNFDEVISIMPYINEKLREYLPLREAKPFTLKTKHVRH